MCADKAQALELTESLNQSLRGLFDVLYAQAYYSLLVVFQGIDASGKDGAIRNLFSLGHPQSLRVFSFKEPTSEELRHDFIWRCHRHTPESGGVALFNRSYYEEVTTAKVHPELLEAQRIPFEIRQRPDFFERRYRHINNFEQLLVDKGTLVVKFFLHISEQEQKIRLEKRLADPTKNWKFSPADVRERKHWSNYMSTFAEMIEATHTASAPWEVIPADFKWYRNYIVSKVLVDRLKALKMTYPMSATQ